MVCQVVKGALARGHILRGKAQEGDHSQAPIAQLLPLVLLNRALAAPVGVRNRITLSMLILLVSLRWKYCDVQR